MADSEWPTYTYRSRAPCLKGTLAYPPWETPFSVSGTTGNLRPADRGKGGYEREDYLEVDSNLIPFGSLFSRSYKMTLSSASVRHKVKGLACFPERAFFIEREVSKGLACWLARAIYEEFLRLSKLAL